LINRFIVGLSDIFAYAWGKLSDILPYVWGKISDNLPPARFFQ
jgi:hypothetical protein